MWQMTDKELKKQIKTAYAVVPSDEEKVFIRRHEKRGLHMNKVIFLEARYMCMRSFIWSIPLFVMLVVVSQNYKPEYAWMISSMVPLCALCPLTAVGKTERYRMEELESACRFSLRLIRMIRLFILEVLSLLFILIGAFISKEICQVAYLTTFIFISLPFLLNIWGCLFIIRKWPGKENIYGCIAMTVFSCALPMVTSSVEWYLPEYISLIAIGVLLFFIGKESYMYVKESEDLTWSLC